MVKNLVFPLSLLLILAGLAWFILDAGAAPHLKGALAVNTPTPGKTGYPSPVQTGYPSPVQTGYPSPVQTTYPSPVQTGYPTPIQTGVPSPIPTRPARPVPPAAHLCVGLEEDPDGAVPPGGVLTYTVAVQNAGPGRAGGLTVYLAFDPALEVLRLQSADPAAVIAGQDAAAVTVRFADLDAGATTRAQLITRVRATAVAGRLLAARATAAWSDRQARTEVSNAVLVAVGAAADAGQHGLQRPLQINPAGPVAAGDPVAFAGDFFGGGEPISFWLNRPGGGVSALADGGRADAAGAIALTYAAAGLPPGAYSLVAHGVCTGAEGVGAFAVK